MSNIDDTLADFLSKIRKQVEDSNPDAVKKLTLIDPTLYQPFYGYIITLTSSEA